MSQSDLKKMNRKQLLELLLKQTERADQLQQQLEEAERKLNDKIKIEKESGSIAEAALKISGVFEAAENAAKLYLENIKLANEQSAANVKKVEDALKRRVSNMLEETEKRCAEKERLADEKLASAEIKLKEVARQKALVENYIRKYAAEKNHAEK